ncbi:hypothetical protein BKA70DRAFT_1224714 [Coprinopsis sp. MPI-PUGE-AT-0042]|nr:hypothetical protein BKA70DRAFT_1224714 [Coprinopsis sp. MPI-PUGE-AT-0042]
MDSGQVETLGISIWTDPTWPLDKPEFNGLSGVCPRVTEVELQQMMVDGKALAACHRDPWAFCHGALSTQLSFQAFESTQAGLELVRIDPNSRDHADPSQKEPPLLPMPPLRLAAPAWFFGSLTRVPGDALYV